MTNLLALANRPTSSLTDADIAEGVAAILSDARVTKAVYVGREGKRPMIDFAMPGFEGVHTLGRVVSALGEEERQAKAAAIVSAKVAKKEAADRAELLTMVPSDGKHRTFERFLEKREKSAVTGDERAELWVEMMLPLMAGLTGSVKQRAWAAVIRKDATDSNLSEEQRAKAFKKFKSSKVWIDNRNNARRIIEAL